MQANGEVYWSRPGILDVLCKFAGLNRFPMDSQLSCDIDFGGWLHSGTFQGVALEGTGYGYGPTDVVVSSKNNSKDHHRHP